MLSHVRAILTMSNVEDLQELANLADKVSEASQPITYQVASTSATTNHTARNSALSAPPDSLTTLTEILTRQFKKLCHEIRDLKSLHQTRSRSTSRHSHSRDRSRNREIKNKIK